MQETYSIIGVVKGKEFILMENATFFEAMDFIEEKGSRYESISIAQERMVEDKPENFVVVSDCRNQLEETKELLDRPMKFKEQFIFLGNFIGSEPGFLNFIHWLVSFRSKRDTVFVRGKNEHNLLEYLHEGTDFVGNPLQVEGFFQDIQSQLNFPLIRLKTKFPKFYQLLLESKPFYENDQFIFASGGVNLTVEFWKESKETDFYETKKEFLLTPNETGKNIVFGNLSTLELSNSKVVRPWYNHSFDKIGINGGCYAGGKLLGLFIQDGEFCFMGVRSKDGKEKEKTAL